MKVKTDKSQISEAIIAMNNIKKKAYKLKRYLLKTHKYDKVIAFPNLNPNLPIWIELYIAIKPNYYHFTIDAEKYNNILFPFNILSNIKTAIKIMEILPREKRSGNNDEQTKLN